MDAQNIMASTSTSAKASHPVALGVVSPIPLVSTNALKTVPSMNRSPCAKLINSMMP